MDSMLEKITLYDIMSYFIPGFLCLALLVFSLFPELPKLTSDTYNDWKGYIGFTFLIFSYVMGIAISSIARYLCEKVFDCFENTKVSENSGMIDTLKRALENSGISSKDIKTNSCDERDSLAKKYNRWIYADIQADPKYKRIHNYASSESMYKNISFAFLLAAVLPLILHFIFDYQLVTGGKELFFMVIMEIILFLIFLLRWKRFEQKKREYAINWFMEKYAAKDDSDSKKN